MLATSPILEMPALACCVGHHKFCVFSIGGWYPATEASALDAVTGDGPAFAIDSP
jgi:hypothetical protein